MYPPLLPFCHLCWCVVPLVRTFCLLSPQISNSAKNRQLSLLHIIHIQSDAPTYSGISQVLEPEYVKHVAKIWEKMRLDFSLLRQEALVQVDSQQLAQLLHCAVFNTPNTLDLLLVHDLTFWDEEEGVWVLWHHAQVAYIRKAGLANCPLHTKKGFESVSLFSRRAL